jgi:hypothetical protein
MRYLPANPVLAYGLDGIEEAANAIDPREKTITGEYPGEYLGKRLGIFLRYVYAGKREQGWAFFERTYNLADKDDLKTRIRQRLEKDPLYKSIYRRQLKAQRAPLA